MVTVLALSDNSNAVHWHRSAGGRGRCPRAGDLIRLIGMMEIESNFSLNAEHLPGVENVQADFISRESERRVEEYMASIRCEGSSDYYYNDTRRHINSNPKQWCRVQVPERILDAVSRYLLRTT